MATDDTTATEQVIPLETGGEATVKIPPAASSEECAALAAAIGAHVTDRQRAAAAAGGGPERVDRWKLAGRLGVRDPQRVPRGVTRGDEWKTAGRIRHP